MLKTSIPRRSFSAMLPIFYLAGIGLYPAHINASTIGISDASNLEEILGKPDHAPPANPPIDTPAFYNGLANTPATMPANIPSRTLPGSGFGQAAVPVPAAVWLFGSGLLGLVGIARRKRTKT